MDVDVEDMKLGAQGDDVPSHSLSGRRAEGGGVAEVGATVEAVVVLVQRGDVGGVQVMKDQVELAVGARFAGFGQDELPISPSWAPISIVGVSSPMLMPPPLVPFVRGPGMRNGVEWSW